MVDTADTAGRVVLVCRDPARRALLERLSQPAETHASPVEAILSVSRAPAAAVVLSLDDVAGHEREVLSALRRAGPDAAVYAVVRPEDEPLARKLLSAGTADYFVLPSDVCRLPAVLRGRTTKAHEVRSAEPQQQVPGTDSQRLLRATGDMASLALAEPGRLFREGAATIVRCLGGKGGCAFAWNASRGRLDLAGVFGILSSAAVSLDNERSLAERAMRAPEIMFLTADSAGVPYGNLLCVPVREAGDVLGVVCVAGVDDKDTGDQSSARLLADLLGRLYRGALQREQYARLALRDSETGLLRRDPFKTYVRRLVERAASEHGDLAVLIIEPQPSAASDEVVAKLGRTIQAALARGGVGGRLDRARYALALARPEIQRSSGEPADAAFRAWVGQVAGLGERVEPGLPIRTALAVYPKDGLTAEELLASAEARLSEKT